MKSAGPDHRNPEAPSLTFGFLPRNWSSIKFFSVPLCLGGFVLLGCAVGPDFPDRIDPITGHLKLL